MSAHHDKQNDGEDDGKNGCENGGEDYRQTSPTRTHEKSGFGLALGGGGARGIAHILILEALDELGIKPKIISGTSIGSIFGAAYASGLSAYEVRHYANELFASNFRLVKKLFGRWPLTDLWNPLTPALFNAETLFEVIMPDNLPRDFSELEIEFLSVAVEFHSQDEIALSSGALLPAIAASCALPALFTPVKIGDHVFIDGGFANPVPFDLLLDQCDLTIAIDVTGEPRVSEKDVPSSMEALLGGTQIMLRSIMREKLKSVTPDILISPMVGRFRLLDFYKLEEILAASEPAKDNFKRAMEKRLKNKSI